MDKPLVSVVIPTYNNKEKLDRLIKSAIDGDYPKDKSKTIVIDDASIDGTYDEIRNRY